MTEYRIIESARKTVCVQITQNGDVIVRVPYRYPTEKIEKIVNENSSWIEKTKLKQKENLSNYIELSSEDIKKLKKLAEKKIKEKVEYYSKLMGVKPIGVKITSAKKRFGSCNAENSLCFSYMLMLYPDEAIDYVVVHELAHIKHHNHSKAFYNCVKEHIPDYKYREKLLKMQQKLPNFGEV